ncbi:MAG TPA: PIN domain-containing protein [Chloroflexota bacterium]|jgi:predicted nucleic acid-binding protein|nr:PIN domain-containing protein [Chloroflexota bacterium]
MADGLIDSDVLIDHMRGARALTRQQGSHYSMVTRCELFAGRYVAESDIRELLGGFIELEVTREIAEAAGRLRRNSHMTTPDALIAATAVEYSLALITRNLRDFASVPGLNVRSPA